ncbi:UDP-N-acetylmuramoyl-tripeptide--D-alanyl-D-alanine ligase [Massilia violaceinigra]|uniref:UDP-N-acetylmuramoyl-tripeptide--D-alanyl-D-alanine ligase n=1 Tax=Massilia violaceinigra TaxID=2045208 RepID=A0ABY3ZYW7_9BURK|nr:UDP-N-acetylmuramoyl-tripeptide--D-alanyl-D-alanine ligase [Massilia violaceinigra]UOD27307.1 UDP-N-acetylmuramoyl-tripeptide--D-alanyl-D-alanine ligase [Massilia violaceinigra]
MHGTLAQLVAAISGARMTADASFTSVSTDSRSAGPGALFVALRGETFDAHDFLAQVAAGGAAAVVVDSLPDGWTLPAIVVPDTLVALGRIANHWRAQYGIPVIGVTGSNGKTTVKEMIAAILAAGLSEDARLATRGNLNNEIGVPLTLMRLGAGHKAAVIELGMNHPGEIARLTAIAAPTIGLVNNAQREHQEFMHTVEAVALENGAVLAGLPFDGVAVFPGDDEYSALWRRLAGGRTCITFGFDAACNVSCAQRATDFGSELDVSVRIDGAPLRSFNVKLAAAGLHNVRNALAAIACTIAAGIAPDAVARGLAAFEPVSGRLQRKEAACGATVIDDTYNANPDSVRAAIDVLAQAGAPRILVLGDMGEVGTQGREFHEEIGAYAAARGIGTVLVTGELTRHMAATGAQHYTQFDELLAALDTQLGSTSDATVLVKGSRFMKMERVVAHLTGSHNTSKEAH